MKIAIASDLHLEFADIDFHNPGADVLVLVGDICTLRHLDTAGKLGNRFRAFFQRCTEQFPHVLYVLGNHESYNSRVERSIQRAQEIPGITLLHNSAITIQNTKFWGATLWTDFDHNPLNQEIARGSMNDYKAIRTEGGMNRLRPQDTALWHQESIHSLQQHRPDVVITHHAPSYRSIPDHYRGDSLNPAYASRLDDLVAHINPKLWIHGHIHSYNDYHIDTTRVVSNPRGYLGHESQATHWQPEIIDV